MTGDILAEALVKARNHEARQRGWHRGPCNFFFIVFFLLFVWKQDLTQNPVKPITHSVAWLGLELLPQSPKYWGLEAWASMSWARSVSLQLSWELLRVPAAAHWFLLGQVSSVSHSLPTRPHYIITILGPSCEYMNILEHTTLSPCLNHSTHLQSTNLVNLCSFLQPILF